MKTLNLICSSCNAGAVIINYKVADDGFTVKINGCTNCSKIHTLEETHTMKVIDVSFKKKEAPQKDLEILGFGNYLMRHKDTMKFYVPSGLDKAYIRMPMQDILEMYRREQLDKVNSKKK